MKQLNDPFEPTPEGFHRHIEQKLNELQRAHAPVPRSYRWIAVLAACLVLLSGTALALSQMGVLDFLTTRIEGSNDVTAENVIAPITQSNDSMLLSAQLRDAYWDGSTLSVCMNVHPIEGYAFYMETDVGADGESFDKIWWGGTIFPLGEWLAGRQAIMLYLPEMSIDGSAVACTWDWVADEQGETLLIQAEIEDLSNGAELTIKLHSVIVGTDTMELATLHATLPAMTKEDKDK